MSVDVGKVLERTRAELRLHPEFLGIEILSVDQRGAMDSAPIHIAARTANIPWLRELISVGANIDAIGDLGHTPLHEAALCGKAAAVATLIEAGADLSLKNEFGQTARDVAVLGKKLEVLEVFDANLKR
jgi:ankyrin repeat protein